jgi:hypothetical protein
MAVCRPEHERSQDQEIQRPWQQVPFSRLFPSHSFDQMIIYQNEALVPAGRAKFLGRTFWQNVFWSAPE